ncbi:MULTISPECIES: hypothetical protein [unclassified Bradyrhizobium]|uniref:hypothetical protein n=1 Tax=unclassified Bradyrhizobium TaxID=2631580 RepID=UPI0020B41D93|nr:MULTISPECIES: hypothetical protein [unclassified Bradyrhizobium]MCP3395889.1 hypothetical protein [Bradyrhizobium sp. CCGB20]MCP3404193.1 hypothetical protein [Bradyrhizobium sp. CCGB01]
METTAYRQSKESTALDANRAALHPPTASFIRARAARADLSQDDPIPLFLSDPLGAPDPSEYEPVEVRSRIVPRVLAAVLTASTVAVVVTLFQSDLRGLFAANAGRWMVVASDQAMASVNAAAMPQTSLKDPAGVTSTKLASADTQGLPAPSTPSREAIATAYQTALQAQTPVALPAPVAAPPAPPPPAKALDADTLAGLMTRAKNLLKVGDIVAARLLLERAANAQDATAAFLLAQTHDPAVLGTSDARSVAGDATVARDWYQKAAALGSAEARQRLTQLQN